MNRILQREIRVAFSRKAQPLWFRILKWTLFAALTAAFWSSAHFWWCAAAGLVLSLALHLFWRWKTRGWTRPWGGWNDLDAEESRGWRPSPGTRNQH